MMSESFLYRPLTTALLVIDLQRYFTQSDSTFARLSEARIPKGNLAQYFRRLDQRVIPNIQRLQQSFHRTGCPVFYTRFGSFRSDGTDLPAFARRLNDAGRWAFGSPVFPPFDDPSTRLDERIESQADETVLPKTTISALASTSLDDELRIRGISAVVVTGVLSAYCVTQTARELADRNFEVAVVEDACASLTATAHEAAMHAFGAVYGGVLSTEELVATITAGA